MSEMGTIKYQSSNCGDGGQSEVHGFIIGFLVALNLGNHHIQLVLNDDYIYSIKLNDECEGIIKFIYPKEEEHLFLLLENEVNKFCKRYVKVD